MKSQRQNARPALLDAFAELALSRRYQDFGVGLIAQRANVARSTFYYHFKAKDDLLLQNLRPMISALARLPAASEPPQDVKEWVAHIWEYRARARRIFDGAAGRKISGALALELRSALGADPATAHRSPLLADQVAGAMFSLLRAWIAGQSMATPADASAMLWSGARALVLTNATVEPADSGSSG